MVNRILWYWLLAWTITLPVSIAGTSILYFPLLGLYVLLGYWTFRQWPPQWGLLEKAFACFWLVSVLSAFLSPDAWHTRVRLGKDLYFLSLVMLTAYLARQHRGSTLMKAFMISAIATAVFGILQRIIGVNQTDNAGGIFLHMPPWLSHAPRSLQNHLSMVNGRVVGTRAHALTYAEGLLFPLGYTLSVLTRPRRDWWKWAIGQYLVLLGLLFSQSRGPWIAAVMMVIVVCIMHRDTLLYKRLALIYFPIALCFLLPSLRARAFTITDTQYAPNAERFEMWQAGRRMVRDHPLLGIGPGNMPLASPQYQSEKRRADGPWGHLHNTYVNVAAERGLLGLLAFLSFIMVLASELWVGYRRAVVQGDEESKIIVMTALLSLVGWLMAGITETVYHDSNVLMPFYFVMGIAVASARGLRHSAQTQFLS